MWQSITVEQYQQIHAVQKEKGDDGEKLLQIICILNNLTDEEAQDLPIKTYHNLTATALQLFERKPEEKYHKRIRIGRKVYKMAASPNKLRYGQYIEVQHFLKGGIIENLHFLAASIASPVRFGFAFKNDSSRHEIVANEFLQANFLKTYESILFFCAALHQFNKGYKSLFGTEDEEDDEEPAEKSHGDGFTERWGWVFAATEIANHERIPLDAVYDLGLIQALNDLAYIKSFKEHEKRLNKKAYAPVNE